MTRFWLAYAVAVAFGLLVAWFVLRTSALAMFGPASGRSLLLGWIGAPMGGLAAFAVAFMPLAGRPLGGKFWGIGTVLVLATAALATLAMVTGLLAPLLAGPLVALFVVGVGAVLLDRERRAR